jgi:hypothetical protein
MRVTIMHKQRVLLAAALLAALAGCNAPAPPTSEATPQQSVDTTIDSRGVAVPVTYTIPAHNDDAVLPLVVMAHGHGGSRHEAGGYDLLAEQLAAQGIASIRMDFPGCGDSSESFAKNNLTNMLEDIRNARDFALSLPNIDRSRVGIHGYSMGGRLAILTAASDESYATISTWAPAASNGAGSMIEFVGGEDAFADMKARAAREGFVPFTTIWGQDQQLGEQFFIDMEESRPLDAAAMLTIPLFVLYGDLDPVVLPAVSEAVIAAATNSPLVTRHVVTGADHGLGIFSGEPHLTGEAVAATVEFLAQNL